MKIQWNSDAAQEVLEHLKKADRGLEDCAQQEKRARSELAEASAEGDNQALARITERFEACSAKLKALAAALEDYESAVRRAEQEFESAERDIGRMADNMREPSAAPYRGGGSTSWEPGAYSEMPRMRMRVAPVPKWLETMTAESGVL